MKKISILTSLLLCYVFVNAQVVNENDALIIKKIKQENVKYTTITSEFKQTQHLSILGEEIEAGGFLYYRKPDQLAMQYSDPEGDMIILDGDNFVLVSGGNRRSMSARSNPKMQGMKTVLSACMQGDVEQIGALKITCEETPKYYIITAVIDEQSNKSDFEQIIAGYDKKDLSLSSIKTIESDGSYTTYELTKKEFNKPVDETIFKGK